MLNCKQNCLIIDTMRKNFASTPVMSNLF